MRYSTPHCTRLDIWLLGHHFYSPSVSHYPFFYTSDSADLETTLVCALALRYCTQMPYLYKFTMDVVGNAATLALEKGLKTIETCQAYILLSLYPVPQKKWTDDRRWLMIGVAVL